MSIKQVPGLLVLVIGIGLASFALYTKQKISAAKQNAEGISDYLPNNSVGMAAKKTLCGEVRQYDNLVEWNLNWSLVAGITLIIIGFGYTVYFRNRC